MKISNNAVPLATRLSDRIRLARHAAKLSQTALAHRVGVTPSAAAQWEHTKCTRPGTERLQAIASATGVTFDWLATGRGDQRRRRSINGDSISAIRLEVFAQDMSEELLLDRFRRLPSHAKDALCRFLEEVTRSRR